MESNRERQGAVVRGGEERVEGGGTQQIDYGITVTQNKRN